MNSKIISVSRRTDIPAFYSDWFMNGIKRGYVDVLSPFNRKYVGRVSLKPKDVICFVFWSKNPKNLIIHLDEIDKLGFKYYFQYTLNYYSSDLEKLVPKNEVIDIFIELSKKIGKEKVIWRYDPIIINDKYTLEYHIKNFEYLVDRLNQYTKKVILSFVDIYRKTKYNTKGINEVDGIVQEELVRKLSRVAKKYGLEIATCSEKIDLDKFGIEHGKCIDDELICKIVDQNLSLLKDKGQRINCKCVESLDIGTYNTCKHYCTYCYANKFS